MGITVREIRLDFIEIKAYIITMSEILVTRLLQDGSFEFTSVDLETLAKQMRFMQTMAEADRRRPGERMPRLDGTLFDASYDAAAVKIAASGFSVEP